jgi:hypothetical protein
MARQQKQTTPFDNIEGALEYVGYLLEASREARKHVETEITCATSPELARKRQALQLVKYKLTALESHVVVSKRLLNDLRKLRRLILEEREMHVNTASV